MIEFYNSIDFTCTGTGESSQRIMVNEGILQLGLVVMALVATWV